MGRNLAEVEALMRRLPDGDSYRVTAQKRAAALDQECGCPTGGASFIATAVLAAGYLLLKQQVTIGTLLTAVGITFAAAFAGKLIGMAVARIRMRVLYHEVAARIARLEAGHA